MLQLPSNKVIQACNIVTDMLGDKAQKSDNPLISAKIDFLDFLVFVVYLRCNYFIDRKGKGNDDEGRTHGKFQSI
jgi:hypothetical protein